MDTRSATTPSVTYFVEAEEETIRLLVFLIVHFFFRPARWGSFDVVSAMSTNLRHDSPALIAKSAAKGNGRIVAGLRPWKTKSRQFRFDPTEIVNMFKLDREGFRA